MGYRLYCRNSGDRQSEICFGKLVGYTDIELKSLQYLLKIRKISKEDYETSMHWCSNNGIVTITLTETEFLKFMHYYIYDWIYAYDISASIHDPIVKLVLTDLLNKPCNKIIEWR